ncbi:shk1 kinase-binding protein 1 [Lyophyllum atratum]|nr:shk1 kinase-binding protein 1 [Lyophyllum atratum]
MASWNGSAALSTFLTLEDISNAAVDTVPYDTPVLKLLAEARSKGYDAISLPLTTEKWKKRWSDMCLLPTGSDREMEIAAEQKAEVWRSRPGFLKDEVTITRLDEAEGVTVMVSDWLELDATDDWVRHDAEIALQQELAYASYLNVQSAILPAPRNREHVASYARIVNSCLKNTPYIHLSIQLPIYNPSVLQTNPSSSLLGSEGITAAGSLSPSRSAPRLIISGSSSEKLSATPEGELNATWEMWDLVRSMCDYNTRLTLTLDLSPPLPTTIGVLSKWAAESVRNILLPASTFIANGKGYPHHPTVILSGANAGHHNRGGETAYAQYVRHMEKTSPAVQAAERAGTVENFAQGYQDYLQAPLQPLMDNLQSVTYQTFEQDPIKYQQYEEAMYRALLEWTGEGKIVICIAGAGRGPLVARCLTAIERSRREAFIYAVEKNPNAFVTLQDRKEQQWGEKVDLLFGDMRFIDVPDKADILVSELLGSFGDNELSPECLDGAMRFLKPEGISIPSSYTAHLAPLSSSKLFNEARASKDPKSLETPYVVMFQAVNILSGEGGLPKTNSHNARSAKLNFYIPHAGVLHGLAGYFEAVLYGNIGLSIHPHRKDQISKNMLSWFPLFFPFREPLYLPSNSELQVSIWRLTTERQVWYEWHAESFLSSPSVTQPEAGLRSPMSAAPASPSASVLSPLIDADDPFSMRNTRHGSFDTLAAVYETVKIGQTSLHNPGGRSSWIGL